MAVILNVSKRKAEAISLGVFLIFLGILFYFNAWWPWILLAVWSLLAIRQILTGRNFDFFLSSLVFLGVFLFSLFNLSWAVLGPLVFIVGGAYIILREYFFAEDRKGDS